MSDAARLLRDAIAGWHAQNGTPLVVAIDGHGAAGKSTLAGEVAEAVGATVVHTDDFFRAAGSADVEGVPMSLYYDWERLRAQALEPLAAGRRASFAAFDWETDALREGLVELEPAAVVVVEGVSAAAPALVDLITRSVLVQTPEQERVQRLHERISDEVWDQRWLEEELAYFGLRPPAWFDLVVSGSSGE
jgi:uridine kinase